MSEGFPSEVNPGTLGFEASDNLNLRERVKEVFQGTCAEYCGLAALSARTLQIKVEGGQLDESEALRTANSRLEQVNECPGQQSTNPGGHYSGQYCPTLSPPLESYKN